jgi:two-component system phosphate regulon sensor histidine kinase PhoR
MVMKNIHENLIFHKVISLLSLTILLIVQANLIYNTYELKNRQYSLDEKELINQTYKQAIRNDVLFPGGGRLLSKYIGDNIETFRFLYYKNPAQFRHFQQQVCNELYTALRLASTMDSLFLVIKKQHRLSDDLIFSLILNSVSVTFDGSSYISIYNSDLFDSPKFYKKEIATGMTIDGTLTNLNRENLITSISISVPSPNTSQVSFSLYVDQQNRQFAILKQMIPTMTLSVASITFVLLIYYFTYRNWLRQKKLADMKSDFLNSITHEFNTPISTILVANKSLQNQEIIAKRGNIKPLTEIIKRQTDRLQALINQALDITSMNRGNIEKSPHDLNKLLQEVVDDYKLKATEKVYLHFEVQAITIFASLNRFLFTTMVYNIFDNAIKYNIAENKIIEVKTSISNSHIMITISDNGIGMSKETSLLIFDKFYRGQHPLKTGGLGLGLYYVKQSLEVHGWTMDLHTQPGEGSKFLIYIPIETNKY